MKLKKWRGKLLKICQYYKEHKCDTDLGSWFSRRAQLRARQA